VEQEDEVLYCPRCNLPVEGFEIGRATIDGEQAHVNCTIDELDENGMDDFHNV
jgi:hypothetical protein